MEYQIKKKLLNKSTARQTTIEKNHLKVQFQVEGGAMIPEV